MSVRRTRQPAGAGGGVVDAKYVVSAAHAGLSAEIVIPGLAGSADIPLGGVNDDEFDSGGSPPAGWTALGAPSESDATTFPSHYYLSTGAGSGFIARGIQKLAPSMPFTFAVKMTDLSIGAADTNNRMGIAVLDAGVTDMSALMIEQVGSGHFTIEAFTCTPTSYTTNIASFAGHFKAPLYLMIVALSSDNVSFYLSYGGHVWTTVFGGHNPGYTVARVAIFGSPDNAGIGPQATFDWARFT